MPQAHVRRTFTAASEVSPEEFKHFLFNTRARACVCLLTFGNHGFRKMFEFEHRPGLSTFQHLLPLGDETIAVVPF